MPAIRQDSCLLHGGGPGPFYKPWGRDGFATGWSFHTTAVQEAPHIVVLQTHALKPLPRTPLRCHRTGVRVEAKAASLLVDAERRGALPAERKIGGDALWQPAFPRSAPPIWRNGPEVMLRGSGCLLASRDLNSVVACPGSMLASPWSRGGVPTHRALVTARSHGPSRRCSGVVLLHSRS